MRQPGGWIYRFEVSNRPPVGAPSVPDWGYGKKAMLRNKLEGVPGGGSVLRPAIESPCGHKWWIEWDIRSDEDMKIYVMDDQSKAILIFQRLSNDFGICCSGDLNAVNEKWQVSYRHPLRTGDVPIVLGYLSSCGYVQYEAGVPYPKERTTVYWSSTSCAPFTTMVTQPLNGSIMRTVVAGFAPGHAKMALRHSFPIPPTVG